MLMSHSRRDFIKFAIAGSITSGCPINRALIPLDDDDNRRVALEGEPFTVCHQLRDGHSFPRPDATRNVDIVIIGGGMAGLSPAYFPRGQNWVALRKET